MLTVHFDLVVNGFVGVGTQGAAAKAEKEMEMKTQKIGWQMKTHRFKLLARRTIVATVLQYNALANESRVMLDMLASQFDLINWPCPLLAL
jgi:hypothetical protein